MSASARDRGGISKLLKLAKADAGERRRRLADLEAAYASATASLEEIDGLMQAEEGRLAARGSDFVPLAGFQEGAREKRRALKATLSTLAVEIREARNALKSAYAEVKKLEHLLEVREKADRRLAAKKEAADALTPIMRAAE